MKSFGIELTTGNRVKVRLKFYVLHSGRNFPVVEAWGHGREGIQGGSETGLNNHNHLALMSSKSLDPTITGRPFSFID